MQIKDNEGKIRVIELVGIDDYNNIYATVMFERKRYLRKYNPEGQLLAEAKIPYGKYFHTVNDLRVTGGGDVYQMLTLKEHVKILKWTLGGVGMSPLSEESVSKLFSDAKILKHNNEC